ncbi:MAG: hypothetical protein AAB947_01500 [Patescibacteria group bacterium]
MLVYVIMSDMGGLEKTARKKRRRVLVEQTIVGTLATVTAIGLDHTQYRW